MSERSTAQTSGTAPPRGCGNGTPTRRSRRGDEIYIIDPNLCSDCVGFYDAAACQTVCPVECCLPDPENEESEEVLISRTLKLHPDNTELRQKAQANDFPSRFRN
ncbi:hypothetical protein GCM10012280_70700 [Wenjunlia tyrosinilytica]|uniref:4Fe-4S ferredoxin-type domain-containing protein n=1 Tax=Wenjunlia tyrosinilytica TaxID=1544741 RepID=A0A917ZY71_9ACTN|nr:hypothetical protein GCM10012280_70700 [Wenjunlia tyrosinilytica]